VQLNPRPKRRIAALLCAALMLAPGPAVVAQSQPQTQSPNMLPSLGDSASEDLSIGAERYLGEQIMRLVRRDPLYMDDPVLLEYVQEQWQPLLEAARKLGEIGTDIDLRYTFEPFLVRDPSVNAFALPGGFIGVHLGLIAMTANRDELAAVLAHELSHVTQRHIARNISVSKRASLLGIAATILGVLAASRASGADAANAGAAAVTGGQAAAIQTQLNFSRDMEREADRVGYGVMSQAGFSSAGMAGMFEKLDQASRLNDSGNYPYLRSHPLTVERIGEARSRMAIDGVAPASGNAFEHATARARASVLMDPRNEILRRLQGADNKAGREAAELTPPERLGAAYTSALASTLLTDWQRADSALALAAKLAKDNEGAPGGDARASRAVQMLGAQSMVERGDPDRAAAWLAPLASDASRPVMLLRSQIAVAQAARGAATAAGAPGTKLALQRSADALQTWVTLHPLDALAWKQLSQVWSALGQTLRAVRAEAEAQYAVGDLPGAIERLRAGQRIARGTSASDYIEASVIDARLRDITIEMRAIMAEQKKGGRLGG
jgi:predicted Zn-dependent protease